MNSLRNQALTRYSIAETLVLFPTKRRVQIEAPTETFDLNKDQQDRSLSAPRETKALCVLGSVKNGLAVF
jgi:hypothetical protein